MLAVILMVFGCKERSPYLDIREPGDDDRHVEVPNTLKQALDNMNIINPTGLQVEVEVLSSQKNVAKSYYKKNGVHYIRVKAGKSGTNMTEWAVNVTKENAHNVRLQSILISTTPSLPSNELAVYTESKGMGIAGKYFYSIEYKPEKSEVYYEPIWIKVRDTQYCKKVVKIAQDGDEDEMEKEKIGGIAPNVSEENTEKDCYDGNNTFNFDQTIEIVLVVDNDSAYARALEEEEKLNLAFEACTKLYAATKAMQLAGNRLELDTEPVEENGETSEKAEMSWANAFRWGIKAAYAVYSVYTTIKMAKDGINCSNLGLKTDHEQVVNSIIGGGKGKSGKKNPQ